MKNGLSRKTMIANDRPVNVFDLATKSIVFTGNVSEVGYFLGIAMGHVNAAIRRKNKVQKKWALRYAKIEKK